MCFYPFSEVLVVTLDMCLYMYFYVYLYCIIRIFFSDSCLGLVSLACLPLGHMWASVIEGRLATLIYTWSIV